MVDLLKCKDSVELLERLLEIADQLEPLAQKFKEWYAKRNTTDPLPIDDALLLLKIGGATMDFCNHMKPYESQIQEMVKKCLGEKVK